MIYPAGAAVILGGLGLILPGMTGFVPRMTAAAVGLIVVVAGAMVWHGRQGEIAPLFNNDLQAAALVYIAYSGWNGRSPESHREPVTATGAACNLDLTSTPNGAAVVMAARKKVN